MAATLPSVVTEPIPSAFLPKGPTARLMLPPKLSEPADIKVVTALRLLSTCKKAENDKVIQVSKRLGPEFRRAAAGLTIRKSVISAPN